MFQAWRVQLRQVEQALRAGQLDEAKRLLSRDGLRNFLPGKRLSLEIADSLVRRACQHAARGETSAGWHDLAAATDLAGERECLADARGRLVERSLTEAVRYIEADDPVAALDVLDRLKGRRVEHSELRILAQVARHVQIAQKLLRRGEFSLAEEELGRAGQLRPDLKSFECRLAAVRVKMEEHRKWSTDLKAALAAEDWPSVVAATDRLLQLAPENPTVRAIRERAWAKLARALRPTLVPAGSASRRVHPDGMTAKAANAWPSGLIHHEDHIVPEELAPANSDPRADSTRFLLWIDAVGGYLVCLGDEIVLGQPVLGGPADVPIVADISRRHAVIRREAENYVLSPIAKTKVDGMPITQDAPLVDGATIELGEGVKLRFRRPNALSGTARLEFVSHHRTKPHVDAVLLMTSACILGPKRNCHVVCSDWPADVILYRDGDQLYCRCAGSIVVDGIPQHGRAPIAIRSQITGDDFSLQLEPC
jgi:hypothetical protein